MRINTINYSIRIQRLSILSIVFLLSSTPFTISCLPIKILHFWSLLCYWKWLDGLATTNMFWTYSFCSVLFYSTRELLLSLLCPNLCCFYSECTSPTLCINDYWLYIIHLLRDEFRLLFWWIGLEDALCGASTAPIASTEVCYYSSFYGEWAAESSFFMYLFFFYR